MTTRSKSQKKQVQNLDLCKGYKKYVATLEEQTIQCVNCDQWWHFDCAQVNPEEAEDIDFQCPNGCILELQTAEQRQTTCTNVIGNTD